MKNSVLLDDRQLFLYFFKLFNTVRAFKAVTGFVEICMKFCYESKNFSLMIRILHKFPLFPITKQSKTFNIFCFCLVFKALLVFFKSSPDE